MPRVPRSIEETLGTAIKSGAGRGSLGGRVDNASYRREPRRTTRAGSGTRTVATASVASKIDIFDDITGTATATFELTYKPRPDSWNVSLNGVTQVDGVDYEIVGRTLTVLAPVDLFGGASVGDPWTLQVQYDYLAGVPTAPGVPATFLATAGVGEDATGTHVFSFAAPPEAGHSVLLFYRSKFGGAIASVSGLGATWTQVGNAPGGIEAWVGASCNGSGATVTVESDHCLVIDCVEIDRALTATGAVFDNVDGGTVAGPITAPGNGVAYYQYLSGAPHTFTPPDGLTLVTQHNAGQGTTAQVRAAASGESIQLDGSTMTAIVGLVRYA